MSTTHAKNSYEDPEHPLFWVNFLDAKTLLELVNEHDDYFIRRRDNFRYTLELAPSKEYAMLTMIRKIENLMSSQEMIEEDMFYLHGGSPLIRWGFSSVLEAENDAMIYLRPRLENEVREFQCSNTPLVFLKRIFPGAPVEGWVEDEPARVNEELQELARAGKIKLLRPANLYSGDVAWLEAVGYIIRGGNYAFFVSWLKEELRHYQSTGSLRKKEDTIVPADLPARVLFGDRMKYFEAMARERKTDLRNGSFHSEMAFLMGVSQGAIEKYLRQASYPFPQLPGGYRSKLRTPENYRAVIDHAENAGWLKGKTASRFDLFARELEQLSSSKSKIDTASNKKIIK